MGVSVKTISKIDEDSLPLKPNRSFFHLFSSTIRDDGDELFNKPNRS